MSTHPLAFVLPVQLQPAPEKLFSCACRGFRQVVDNAFLLEIVLCTKPELYVEPGNMSANIRVLRAKAITLGGEFAAETTAIVDLSNCTPQTAFEAIRNALRQTFSDAVVGQKKIFQENLIRVDH